MKRKRNENSGEQEMANDALDRSTSDGLICDQRCA